MRTPRPWRTKPGGCGLENFQATSISGSGWGGLAERTSYDTMGQMQAAFSNIVNMLHGVRDGLIRDANQYEQQEAASQQILSS